MNDQTWALALGFLLAVGVRVLDSFLPKGRAWKWVWQRTVAVDDDLSPIHRDDAASDAKTDVRRRQKDRDTDTGRRERDAKLDGED